MDFLQLTTVNVDLEARTSSQVKEVRRRIWQSRNSVTVALFETRTTLSGQVGKLLVLTVQHLATSVSHPGPISIEDRRICSGYSFNKTFAL